MLNFERVADLLAGFTMIRFFPADAGGRLELAKMVAAMATEESQVEWLVQRAISLYAEWPGAREIRACFCSKYRPADGLSVGSSVYADGIPSERRIEAPALPALPPGSVTVERQLDNTVKLLARSKDLNRHLAPRVLKDSIPLERRAEIQAQIDQAVLELRDKRSRAELGEVAE